MDTVKVQLCIEQLWKQGYSIIPVDENKRPLVKWKKFQHQQIPLKKLNNLIKKQHRNFALVCGYEKIEVIDIDLKNISDEKRMEVFYNDLVEAIPLAIWQMLVVQDTPSGGKHFIYKTNSAGPNQHLAENLNGKPLIETRGKGGYVLIDPSKGYKVVEGELNCIQVISDIQRDELFRICKQFNLKLEKKSDIESPQNSNPLFRSKNKFDEDLFTLVESTISSLEHKKVDLTANYNDWYRICFALVNEFGEISRPLFHRLSQFFPKYEASKCDKKFDDILGALKNNPQDRISIATFFYHARKAGINIWNTEEGKISKKFKAVISYLLTKDLRRNNFTGKIELPDGKRLEDLHLNSMYADMQELNISVSKAFIESIIHSNRTSCYNPTKEILEHALASDSTDEINDLINALSFKVHNDKDIDLLRILIIKWLMQIPGVVYDEIVPRLVLVFIGPSHIGKTYFLRNFFPPKLLPYYAESALNNGKDSFILMSEKLIINNDEFGGIMKMNTMEQFKRIASAETFDERRPYGKFTVSFKRKAILCGTSNRSEVIMDQSAGNTRIIPVEIESIDRELFNSIDKMKLLGCITRLYLKEGKNCSELSSKERDQLIEFSNEYQTTNFEQEAILRVFEHGDKFYFTGQIIEKIKQVLPGATITVKQISSEMKELGFKSGRKRHKNQNLRGWYVKPIPQTGFIFQGL